MTDAGGQTWLTVALAAVNVVQLVALTWIAAWQQRAALEVRRLNGQVVDAVDRVTARVDARR